jgi:CheY-like chemotaxis protein
VDRAIGPEKAPLRSILVTGALYYSYAEDLNVVASRLKRPVFPRWFNMVAPETAKTILIIEDNEIQRDAMAAVLHEAGYAATIAPSVDVALVYPECNRPPALILLDMTMPEKDGWYFLEARKKKPALALAPILILTGLAGTSQEWAESLGAVGVLTKPFAAKDLLCEVRRHCG